VHTFLNRIAEEMTALWQDLAASEEEAARVRCALRDWQTQYARHEEERRRREAALPPRHQARPMYAAHHTWHAGG
jgi:hypothetical protein